MTNEELHEALNTALEGTEVALKLTGSAAKNIAAALYVIAKDSGKNQTSGRQKLATMALFALIPDNDSSFNFLVSILYNIWYSSNLLGHPL